MLEVQTLSWFVVAALLLIRYLVGAAGRNANFLLNVGPMPNGKIQPEFEARLRAIGAWLERYDESIYLTRGGPIAPGPWGVSTQTADTVFVHVLDWDGPVLALPTFGRDVVDARLLRTQDTVRLETTDAALLLTLPSRPDDLVDEVVALRIR